MYLLARKGRFDASLRVVEDSLLCFGKKQHYKSHTRWTWNYSEGLAWAGKWAE
jgi:hypothetical protein